MNKSLYIFLISFLGLKAVCGIIGGIMYFKFGARIFTFESFTPWFVMANIVSIMALLLLLKYYHYRKYWFTFSAGGIVIIATICHAVVTYTLLVSRGSGAYYIPTIFFSLVAGIVYALSLMFSNAGKEFWLKASGTFILIIGLVLISTVSWHLISPNNTSENISQWASIVSSLSPVLFIMQFKNELNVLKKERLVRP